MGKKISDIWKGRSYWSSWTAQDRRRTQWNGKTGTQSQDSWTPAQGNGEWAPKKSSGNRKKAILSKSKNAAKYLVMKELHETRKYNIEWMCKQLNIHRSAYYKWLKQSIPANEQEDVQLAEIIMEYHQKYGGILGYRRMCSFINRDYKKNYNTKRIRRIMNILGIHSTIRRTRRCCTVSNMTDKKAKNILHREFEAY